MHVIVKLNILNGKWYYLSNCLIVELLLLLRESVTILPGLCDIIYCKKPDKLASLQCNVF